MDICYRTFLSLLHPAVSHYLTEENSFEFLCGLEELLTLMASEERESHPSLRT